MFCVAMWGGMKTQGSSESVSNSFCYHLYVAHATCATVFPSNPWLRIMVLLFVRVKKKGFCLSGKQVTSYHSLLSLDFHATLKAPSRFKQPLSISQTVWTSVEQKEKELSDGSPAMGHHPALQFLGERNDWVWMGELFVSDSWTHPHPFTPSPLHPFIPSSPSPLILGILTHIPLSYFSPPFISPSLIPSSSILHP